MAVLCLLTNTPWPWPTPARAASARGGVSPTRNEMEGGRRPVCTSAARKTAGHPLRAPGAELLRKVWLPCLARSAGFDFGMLRGAPAGMGSRKTRPVAFRWGWLEPGKGCSHSPPKIRVGLYGGLYVWRSGLDKVYRIAVSQTIGLDARRASADYIHLYHGKPLCWRSLK